MEEKKGFFAKLFGKKQSDQPADAQAQAPADQGSVEPEQEKPTEEQTS